MPVGLTIEDELKFEYGADELDKTIPLEIAELSELIVEEATLLVPVGPTTNVKLVVGYGAELGPKLFDEDEAPLDALDCVTPVLKRPSYWIGHCGL